MDAIFTLHTGSLYIDNTHTYTAVPPIHRGRYAPTSLFVAKLLASWCARSVAPGRCCYCSEHPAPASVQLHLVLPLPRIYFLRGTRKSPSPPLLLPSPPLSDLENITFRPRELFHQTHSHPCTTDFDSIPPGCIQIADRTSTACFIFPF